MKFVALAALVATAQAAVGASCDAETPCEDTECCGVAVPNADEGNESTENLQVCQTDTETEFIQETEEAENYYTFSCGIPEGSGDAAEDQRRAEMDAVRTQLQGVRTFFGRWTPRTVNISRRSLNI